MRTLQFPAELIREYYTNDFGIDLRQYFKMVPMVNHRDIAFIAHPDWHFNPQRKCKGSPANRYSLSDYENLRFVDFPYVEKETEKNFIFAGIFYFLVLVPQTLREMFGKEVEYDFYLCTGWPLISAGLGGYLPPKQMLEEASLFPCEVERENFHRMLTEVVPFMTKELQRFFRQEDSKNLNDKAYRGMLAGMTDKVEDFLSKINKHSAEFSASFSNR